MTRKSKRDEKDRVWTCRSLQLLWTTTREASFRAGDRRVYGRRGGRGASPGRTAGKRPDRLRRGCARRCMTADGCWERWKLRAETTGADAACPHRGRRGDHRQPERHCIRTRYDDSAIRIPRELGHDVPGPGPGGPNSVGYAPTVTLPSVGRLRSRHTGFDGATSLGPVLQNRCFHPTEGRPSRSKPSPAAGNGAGASGCAR